MSSNKERIKHLQSLLEHEGWALLRHVIRKEIMNSAMQLADNKPIPDQQITFQRGAMWSAKQMLELPNRVIELLKVEDEINRATKPLDSEK